MAHEFACADAGAIGCSGKIKAADEEQLKAKLLEHVQKKHGIDAPTQTILDHLLATVRQS